MAVMKLPQMDVVLSKGNDGHSPHYKEVKKYYDRKQWTIKMVREAVGRWITEEEYFEITGFVYPAIK